MRGINKDQFDLLKKRKRWGSEYEKCQKVYKILWPDIEEGELPCPCELFFPFCFINGDAD